MNGFRPGAISIRHHAAEAGSLAAAEVLLKLGADPKATNRSGATPLAIAKRRGMTEVAAVLEKAGRN